MPVGSFEPMYFSCNIEPDMARTECRPLSRIRASRDDLVLLFFAKLTGLLSRSTATRFHHVQSEARYDGQRMLHFNDMRWYITTSNGKTTTPARGEGISRPGLCYFASWRLMRFSTRRTPCTWLASDAAETNLGRAPHQSPQIDHPVQRLHIERIRRLQLRVLRQARFHVGVDAGIKRIGFREKRAGGQDTPQQQRACDAADVRRAHGRHAVSSAFCTSEQARCAYWRGACP